MDSSTDDKPSKRSETSTSSGDTVARMATALRSTKPAPSGVVRTLPVAFASDAALADALGDGQPRAAAAAWDRYSPLVRGLLRRALGPCADVDDAVQDVFLILLRRVRDLRDKSALTSFVVGITIRVARSALRKRRVLRWIPLVAEEPSYDAALPNVDFASREALRRLYKILDGLDSEVRLAFVLRHAEGLELTEIATALDCSLATAKRRLAKASERVLFHSKRDPVLLEMTGFGAAEPPTSGSARR